MQLKDSQVDNFKVYLTRKGMLAATTECYVRDVQGFKHWISLSRGHFGFEGNIDIELYLRHLEQNQKDSINSIRRKLISLKQFFRFFYNTELGQSSPVDEIPIPARDESLPDILDHEQISKLLEMTSKASSEFKKLRDRSILLLLAYEGLKANELMQLKWSDLIISGNQIGSLKIIGSKSRVIRLIPDVKDSLVKFQKHMLDQHTKVYKQNIAMFNGILGRSGSPSERPISRHGIKFMLYDVGKTIELPKLNTELLRHYAIGYHLDLGKSAENIKDHFGLKQIGNIGKHARLKSSKEHLNDTP